MNPDVLADMQRRLREIERTMVRYRAGEVTGTGPLDVALGGSPVSYEDVRSVQAVESGNQVGALVFGNDLLVLGEIGDGDQERRGVLTLTWPGGAAMSNALNLNTLLGWTPTCFVGSTADIAGFVIIPRYLAPNLYGIAISLGGGATSPGVGATNALTYIATR